MLVAALGLALSVGILMLIPTGVVSARLWRVIKLRHPEVWSGLGEPRLEPMSIGKSRRLRSFIRTRAYEQLADPAVNSYARILRVLNLLLTVVFWIGVVLVLLVAASAGCNPGSAAILPLLPTYAVRDGAHRKVLRRGRRRRGS